MPSKPSTSSYVPFLSRTRAFLVNKAQAFGPNSCLFPGGRATDTLNIAALFQETAELARQTRVFASDGPTQWISTLGELPVDDDVALNNLWALWARKESSRRLALFSHLAALEFVAELLTLWSSRTSGSAPSLRTSGRPLSGSTASPLIGLLPRLSGAPRMRKRGRASIARLNKIRPGTGRAC
jgi:hypothetical protein